MKIIKQLFVLLCIASSLYACKSDDNDPTSVPPRDRGEQQITDNDSIIAFLETHFYNYDEFDFTDVTSAANDNFQIVIGKREGADADKIPLIDQVEARTINYEDTEYTYYVLKLRQGGGKSYSFADNVDVTYRGQTLDLETFDIRVTQERIDLLNVVKGYQVGLAEFNAAESLEATSDGFIKARNGGIGAIFIPSGLGYYNLPPTGIEQYSPLIFSINVYNSILIDHDADGVPTHMEDLDGNRDLFDDNTDSDTAVNYVDSDDDGDGTLTENEIVQNTYTVDTTMGESEPILATNEVEVDRDTVDGIITILTVTFTDTDGDGTPDYLDAN